MINIIFATAFVLGVLILIHELGHFMVAKRIGIRVEKFSLGFGPKILSRTRGETEYVLSLLPVGGYVKMTGENPDEEVTGADYEFASRTVGERMAVVFAGPFMNLILTFVLLYLVNVLGKPVPKYLTKKPVIGWVEQDSPAEKGGLKIGDRILSFNGKPMETWDDANIYVMSNPSEKVTVMIDRGGSRLTKRILIDAPGSKGVGYLGALHFMAPEIGRLNPGFPAAKAGLKKGDLIVSLDGRAIHHWLELSQIIHKRPGQEVTIVIKRNGLPQTFKITPKSQPSGEGKPIGLIGISPPSDQILKKYGAIESFYYMGKDLYKLTSLTYDFLAKLVQGRVSGKQVGGPIMIASAAGVAADAGLSTLLNFMAMLSLQLAILNLFPVPVLDGGHILFLALEALVRKPINERIRELSQQVGMVLLLMLMVYVFYNDIMRIFVG
ncbi:MAG: RIP metalloprotease RseP [bacterium]